MDKLKIKSKILETHTSKRKNFCIFAFVFLIFDFLSFILAVPSALAQVTSDVPGLALAATDPRIIAARIIRAALGLLGVTLLALIAYGGVLWMTAAGDEERIAKAKKVLVNAVVGMVIVLSAFAITQFVLRGLLQATGGPAEVGIAESGGVGGFPADLFVVRGISPKGEIKIRNAVVRVVFNRKVDPASVNSSTFQVERTSAPGAPALERITGTVTVLDNVIEFRPEASCPPPNQERKCFEADTWVYVSAAGGIPALRSADGRSLTCFQGPGGRPSCRGDFKTGAIVDVASPTVTIESPDQGASVPVDSCMPVQARVRDDGGVALVEFYADGRLIEDGAVVPSGDTSPIDALIELPCWPTEPPAPARHRLRAKAFDIDDNSATSSEVEVVVRPLHCFNAVKDNEEDGMDCDSAVSGPSGCGLCDGATCSSSRDCQSGACVNGRCASLTTITGVSPGDGREGTFVTLGGVSFGTTAGRVTFKDNKIATAPQACASAAVWSDNYALVGVPDGAITGPVTVERAGCAAGDSLCRDATDDIRGPIVPVFGGRSSESSEDRPPDGSFWVNNTAHPGLCSVNPTRGLWNTRVDLAGVQFGETRGSGNIWFGQTPGAGIADWSDTSASTAVPPVSYGPLQVQLTNNEGVSSNALPFSVLSPDAGTLPEIVSITPSSGGIGAGITISGRNFGVQPGSAYFVASDGTVRLADVSLPAQCGSTWWTPNTITVKVPSGLSTGDFEIYVHRYDGQQSNRKEFDVTNTPPGPFLACIRPLGGPAFTNVSVYGERLGDTVAPPRGLYFTHQDSSAILAFEPDGDPNPAWTGARANLTGSGGVRSDSCPPGGWSSVEACAQVPTVARTGTLIVEQDAGGLTRRSNPLSFTVGSCQLPQDNPLRLDCGPLTCCGDGSCSSACPATVAPTSAYGWQFTTSPAPLIPQVLERCDTTPGEGHPLYPPSPAPFAASQGPQGSRPGRPESAQVCANAAVAVSLSTAVLSSTLSVQNIKVDECRSAQNLISGANSSFGGATTLWGPPPPPDLAPPHLYQLLAERVQGSGRGADPQDTGNFALRLTKLDDDTGPGWPNELGIQQNYEHWFGYEADLDLDTQGKTYTVSAWMRAGSATAVGKRAGILIQRAGGAGGADTSGFWQKAVQEITLTDSWQQVSVTITFDSGLNSSASGFVRVFTEGLPHDIRVPEPAPDPAQIFSVLVDDVQVLGDPCSTTSPIALENGAFDPYPDQTGFRFWTLEGWQPDTWYRVTLIGGADGIQAADAAGRQGQPMAPLQDAGGRCGYENAAYCFRFKTSPTNEACRIGGVAIVPNPWTARTENERIDYTAVPVSAQDACLALNPEPYLWSWSSTDPVKAAVSYSPPEHLGRACSNNADCPIGRSVCSNDAEKRCISDAQCGEGNTCEDLPACTGGAGTSGYCRFMPWTTTTVALEDTEGVPVGIEAEVAAQEVDGRGDLFIDFEDPRVVDFWPRCGQACTNVAVGAAFNSAMYAVSETAPASLTNPDNVRLWAVSCGNGIVEKGEDCDDGGLAAGDGCSAVCLQEGSNFALRCGNGVRDDGEDCDDGNIEGGDGCSAQCLNEGATETCGNGEVDFAEDCDDGNTQSGDGCSNVCVHEGTRADLAICGNRRLDRGEECEADQDGNFAPWCELSSCLRRGPTAALQCGNGRIDPGEECDPNSSLLDTAAKKALCTSSCQWTGTRRPETAGGQGCGNGRIEIGEDCDDGGLAPGDGCDSFCRNDGSVLGTTAACGNDLIDTGEDCDDGNIEGGDGCSAQCLNEGRPSASCGNRLVDHGEDCDRGLIGNNLCTSRCLNAGLSTRCGNGARDDGEDCDDGNKQSGDGCSASCLNEGGLNEPVSDLTLSYEALNKTLTIAPPSGVLRRSTFYRVLLRGDEPLSRGAHEGIHSCRAEGCATAAEPLSGLNYFYKAWDLIDNPATLEREDLPPLTPSSCIPSSCNTFSWTFKTAESVCEVNRVALSPEAASLYVIGGRQRFRSQPYGPPDSCSPSGQRLNPLTYSWGWDTTKAGVVADIWGRTLIDGVEHKGVDVILTCGNGAREAGEDCDDSNVVSGDGCSSSCLHEGSNFPLACGNGRIDLGEECDLPSDTAQLLCTAACQRTGVWTAGATCGNERVEQHPAGVGEGVGEDCDDGGVLAGDGCSPRCLNEGTSPATGQCGDGVIEASAGEECDPADAETASFCNPNTCLLRPTAAAGKCGNRHIDTGEDCDDGNTVSGDGCAGGGAPAPCTHEGTAAPVCGNGVRERGEDCDDGNAADGDGCSAACLNEGTRAVPGDLRIDPVQQAQAQGIEKFCRPSDGPFPSARRPCADSSSCANGEVCSAPNPWSATEVQATAQGKTGAAALTVFCVAATDRDCPAPGGSAGSPTVGRGADNCCYSRPAVVGRTPVGWGACRNAAVHADFSETMALTSFTDNVVLVYGSEEPCPAGQRELTVSGELTAPSSGVGEHWCADPKLTLSATEVEASPEAPGSAIVFTPSRMLGNSSEPVFYRIAIVGDRNIEDGEVSGVRSDSGVGLHGSAGGVDLSWQFTTGTQVCTLDEVEVLGGTTLTETGQRAPVQAAAYSRQTGGLQEITPNPGYAWSWSWGTSDAQIADVTNTDDTVQTVTAQARNGVAVINATAKITEDSARAESRVGQCSAGHCSNRPELTCAQDIDCGEQVGTAVTGTTEFTLTLCENPWPRDPETLNRLSDHENNPLGGSLPTNFSTWYCRDAGVEGTNDDLPSLKYPPAVRFGGVRAAVSNTSGTLSSLFPEPSAPYLIASSHPVPSVLKEILMTSTTVSAGRPRDEAIGVRVMSNPERLALKDWYERAGLGGRPAPRQTIDGYEAMQEGNTVYIAALNAVGSPTRTVYSNVYIVSLSEGASTAMKAVRDQILANLIFNVNITDTKKCQDASQQSCTMDLECALSGTVVCNARKAKLTRDLVRLNHLAAIQSALAAYRQSKGRYPTLEAGTFVRSLTTSRWPSWGATLGVDLGFLPPQDPINRFASDPQTGAPCFGGYSPATCWNEREQRYRCPVGSRIYQYQSQGGIGYTLSSEFELLERPEETPLGWDLVGWPSDSDSNATISTGGICTWKQSGDFEWSNAQAICGNRIIEQRPDGTLEQCEPGSREEQLITLSPARLRCTGKPSMGCSSEGQSCGTDAASGASLGVCQALTSCTAVRSCRSNCQWELWSGRRRDSDLTAPTVEDCVGGTFCGNGVRDDVDGDGSLDEFCDDGALNGQYGRCNNTCTGLGQFCGNDVEEGRETCDDGDLNGTYGHCRFDCSGPGERCGDQEVQPLDEECDGGAQTARGFCKGGARSGLGCESVKQCEGGRCELCPATARVCFGGSRARLPCEGDAECWKGGTCSATALPLARQRSCGADCTWSEWSPCRLAPNVGCGNGNKEGDEQCDDGNQVNEDGCTNACELAFCGDGIDQGRVCTGSTPSAGRSCSSDSECGTGGRCQDVEECDLGAANGERCLAPYNGTCTSCDRNCNVATRSGGFCGDNVWQSIDEQCEGTQGLVDFVCKGTVGTNERFWHFDDTAGWNSIDHASSIEQGVNGYNSQSSLKVQNSIIGGVQARRGARFRNALSSTSGKTYTVSAWVNESSTTARNKEARLSLRRSIDGQGCLTPITIDGNRDTWQSVSCTATFSSLSADSSADVELLVQPNQAYSVLFDQVHVAPALSGANLTCAGGNCRARCTVGTPCQNYTKRCEIPPGGTAGAEDNSGAPCDNDDDCRGNTRCLENNFDRVGGLISTTSLQRYGAPANSALNGQYLGDSIAEHCDTDKDNDGDPAFLDCNDQSALAHHDNPPETGALLEDGLDNDCDRMIDSTATG